jgi:hypothetical protein
VSGPRDLFFQPRNDVGLFSVDCEEPPDQGDGGQVEDALQRERRTGEESKGNGFTIAPLLVNRNS